MNEFTKTIIFLGIAVFAVAAAFLGRPGRIGSEAPDEVGQAMFPDMKDPADAQSLEIVEYDETRGTADTFSIEQRQGLWTIPSHEDYPADATENLQAAATMFVGLDVINVASEDKKSHAEYGVVAPDPESSAAVEGAGKLVRIKDAKGVRLVELVVGKEVPEREGQRYVRRPGQDRVYTVALDADKFSTKFEDWVQQDVLDLEAMEIKQIAIRDYSVTPMMTQRGPELVQDQRLDLQVSWNADEFQWQLDRLMEFRNEKMLPTELLEDEELDSDMLNELKNALADLKIVDVAAKPAALREGLKGNFTKISQDRDAQQSLVSRGFYPVGLDNNGITIASTDGEVVVKTNDSVQYELYFGQIAGTRTEGDTNSINRYVMIAAGVDKESIPLPELEEVPAPAVPAAPGPTAPSAEGDVTAAEAKIDEAELTDEERAEKEARDAIIKENERKQNAYDELVQKAQDKVDQLNFRLADWYYVISEEVYNDIHLSRKDVVSAKEGSTESGFGVDAFRELEKEGLNREVKEEDAPVPGIGN